MKHDRHEVNAALNRSVIVEMIATETHLSFDEVKSVYDHEYAHLKAEARVFDYLVLLAARRTRAKLARSH